MQNRELRDAPLTVPVLALAETGAARPICTEALKPLARDLQGGVLSDCGHYIPEEQRAARRMLAFLRGWRGRAIGAMRNANKTPEPAPGVPA